MKRKVEKQVGIILSASTGDIAQIYWDKFPPYETLPATLTYEVDEPEQTVTITESQLVEFSYALITRIWDDEDSDTVEYGDLIKKMGFK